MHGWRPAEKPATLIPAGPPTTFHADPPDEASPELGAANKESKAVASRCTLLDGSPCAVVETSHDSGADGLGFETGVDASPPRVETQRFPPNMVRSVAFPT